jgi:phenylpyruvate tautomerase PptA (4-oxalocrotonate tautomerase family)
MVNLVERNKAAVLPQSSRRCQSAQSSIITGIVQMPILELTVVLREDETLPEGLAAAIADAASTVFGSAPGRTWVRLVTLVPGGYAEDSGGPPDGVSPVFVTVLKAQVGDEEEIRREAASLTEVIAATLHRPVENLHLIYDAPANGRISFGGRLQTE